MNGKRTIDDTRAEIAHLHYSRQLTRESVAEVLLQHAAVYAEMAEPGKRRCYFHHFRDVWPTFQYCAPGVQNVFDDTSSEEDNEEKGHSEEEPSEGEEQQDDHNDHEEEVRDNQKNHDVQDNRREDQDHIHHNDVRRGAGGSPTLAEETHLERGREHIPDGGGKHVSHGGQDEGRSADNNANNAAVRNVFDEEHQLEVHPVMDSGDMQQVALQSETRAVLDLIVGSKGEGEKQSATDSEKKATATAVSEVIDAEVTPKKTVGNPERGREQIPEDAEKRVQQGSQADAYSRKDDSHDHQKDPHTHISLPKEAQKAGEPGTQGFATDPCLDATSPMTAVIKGEPGPTVMKIMPPNENDLYNCTQPAKVNEGNKQGTVLHPLSFVGGFNAETTRRPKDRSIWPEASPDIISFEGRIVLKRFSYEPFRLYPNCLHNDESMDFGLKLMADTNRAPLSAGIVEDSVALFPEPFAIAKVRSLYTKQKGDLTWHGLQTQAAQLERLRPPSPMGKEWMVLPLFLPSGVCDTGNYQFVAIQGMHYIFSTVFQKMREKTFSFESGLQDLIDVQKGRMIIVVDSNGSQTPYLHWKLLAHMVKLLFVLVLDKENIPGLTSTRTRSKKEDCFTIPLKAAKEVASLYEKCSVLVHGPQQKDGTSCGSFVLTNFALSRTKAYLTSIEDRIYRQVKLPQAQKFDEDGYEIPHQVVLPSLFSRETVNEVISNIQEIIELRFKEIEDIY